MFWLVSTVRHAATKLGRVTSPQRHRRKQYVCGGLMRLVPSRPQPITQEQLNQHYDELWQLQQRGIVQVRVDSVEGRVFQFGAKAEEPPVPEPVEEIVVTEAEEPEVEEVEVDVPVSTNPSLKPDFTRMSKTALLEWLYTNTGAKEGSYDEHSKKELIKIAESV